MSTKTDSKAHLLMVDDDRLVVATTAFGLEQVGYKVSSAESAEEAEFLLSSGLQPDLAILDVRMAGQDGLYLATRLHALDHIPFVMFSAYSEQSMIDEAARLGAMGYLVKPLDVMQMIPTIEASLARANELQSLRDTRAQLQAALDGDRIVSIAVGIVMVQQALDRKSGFEYMRNQARQNRRSLVDLARQIVQSAEYRA